MTRPGWMLLAGSVLMSISVAATAAPSSLDEAITRFNQQADEAESRDQARLDALVADRSKLTTALEKARAARDQAKTRQTELERRFDSQQKTLDELRDERAEKGAGVSEVAHTLSGQIDKLAGSLKGSWVVALYPSLVPSRPGDDALPSAETFQTLGQQLSGLMARTGQVSLAPRPVAGPDGTVSAQPVMQLGNIMSFTAGHLLSPPQSGQPLIVAPRTPSDVADRLTAFIDKRQGAVPVDASGGDIVKALADQPGLMERLKQGGIVGYITLALGAVGLLVALVQWLYLQRISLGVRRQIKQLDQPKDDNPLGRVLARFKGVHAGSEPEALEARLDELLLAEQPVIERGQSLVKLIAAIAPLMGLLGTVTGMIGTFQSITVFGSSDPKLMAGGISQALITTVIGLVVAIPVLFAHTGLTSRSRKVLNVLEGQASAHLAERLERPADRNATGGAHVPSA
ncbi:MotA/TolQ/ExbB proton channel family protein [Larsenimonas rhizosphaerae]|uniref:MotA/TolQ/ExbB proton channel family protein n=1 Tax=Larsenimonas rhizosphaerae TaxID=2944682 RepID=A0AA41ZE56_9GAMM|nr:MotA/TolQ/ExbB proton channel family protein [Larsenimonas rhizosphaerae]MCM2130947.1 MotA/TolQ/ExbB proton channel family protein [Larsenimonas rhizosphaerae]MCX2523652.1 MotA/TolQ/ExbB proton channel family protein [Larsenimonas rhizosphaerae]